jgi:hypothetical protein
MPIAPQMNNVALQPASLPTTAPVLKTTSAAPSAVRVDPLAGLVAALTHPELYRITVSDDGLIIEALNERTAVNGNGMMM